jgi:NitT/TauT family transport system ATP-binding protein
VDERFKKIRDSVLKPFVSIPVQMPPEPEPAPEDPAHPRPRRAGGWDTATPNVPGPSESGQQPASPDDEAAAPVVELVNVSKKFQDPKTRAEYPVFTNLNLTLRKRGEFVVLLGPSGCGKSTVLSLISGLMAPDSGEIRSFGNPVIGVNPHSATVPQAYTCFPWLTALGNVEFGLGLRNMPEDQKRSRAMEYLNKVGLGDRAQARPKQLSGGMQQRVAIARTLAVKPAIMLMDEPFGALDAQTREEMQQMLLQLWDTEKNTVIFVTHDITEALLLADRVIVFGERPNGILKDIVLPFPYERPPQIVQHPNFVLWSAYLRNFFRRHSPDVGTPACGVGGG